MRFEGAAFFANLPYKAHQGVVAFASRSRIRADPRLLASPRPGSAASGRLDHVTDPHNVGAIFRSAECAGADGLDLAGTALGRDQPYGPKGCGRRGRLRPVVRVSNVNETIRTSRRPGFGSRGRPGKMGRLPMGAVDFGRDLALVIGAEGEGIAPLVKRECDYLVGIPMQGGPSRSTRPLRPGSCFMRRFGREHPRLAYRICA